MKKLNVKSFLAVAIFAAFSLVSCKDKTSGSESGADAGNSYDETQAPTGEPGAAQGVGADGGTGLPYDSTSTGTQRANGDTNNPQSGTSNGQGNTTSGSSGSQNSGNQNSGQTPGVQTAGGQTSGGQTSKP
ncbi:hypothetical protein HYN59_16360 [Flavobacterium album]|uniref:Lipoprotein n=1 Tax=Flavobacterium album TaxID=2175091 RepID=A0A2S1R1J1_9FLAO|nr:hypothetical protein [Flavobacterium album]AWH86583.1 hypothetical protein HYN59_16360 [Flavobacterium album]